jgi:hypothetical protein
MNLKIKAALMFGNDLPHADSFFQPFITALITFYHRVFYASTG